MRSDEDDCARNQYYISASASSMHNSGRTPRGRTSLIATEHDQTHESQEALIRTADGMARTHVVMRKVGDQQWGHKLVKVSRGAPAQPDPNKGDIRMTIRIRFDAPFEVVPVPKSAGSLFRDTWWSRTRSSKSTASHQDAQLATLRHFGFTA